MWTLRKLSVMALVVVFLLSVTVGIAADQADAGPSDAVKLVRAPFPDADDIDDLFVEDFAILGATGIYIGDARGYVKPMSMLTRAEFCVVSMRVLKLERVARAMEAVSPDFPDVVYPWMFGWINAAAAQGIVEGYPDGTFRPQSDVTFAEASTMLLRALRYDVRDPWPAGPYSQAISLDIIDDEMVALGPDVPVTREDMARMVRNTMFNVPRAVDGEHPREDDVDEDDWKYLFTMEEGNVDEVNLQKGTIKIDGYTYDLAAKVTLFNAENLEDLEETTIYYLLNRAGEVAYIDADVVSRVTGEFIELDIDDNKSTITIKVDDEKVKYDLRWDAEEEELDVTVRINDESFKLSDDDDIKKVKSYEDDGHDITLTIAGDVVTRAVMTIDTYEDVLFADMDYDEDDDEATIEIWDEDGMVSDELELDEDTAILLDGRRVSLEKLAEAWDVFDSRWDAPAIATVRTKGDSDDEDAYVIWISVITKDIVDGELERIGRDWVRIDGDDYDYDDDYLGRSDFQAVGIGRDIVVLLNHAEKIQVILDDEPVDDQYFAILTDYVTTRRGIDVELELADGTEVTLQDVSFDGFDEDVHMNRVVFVVDDADIYDVNDDDLANMDFEYEVKAALRYRTSTSTVIRYYTNDAEFRAALSPLADDVFYYDLEDEDFGVRGDLSAGDLLHEVFLLDGVVGYVRYVPGAYVNLQVDRDVSKKLNDTVDFDFTITATYGEGLESAHGDLEFDVLIDATNIDSDHLDGDVTITMTVKKGEMTGWSVTVTPGDLVDDKVWLSDLNGGSRALLRELAGEVHDIKVVATADSDFTKTVTLHAVAGADLGDADDPDVDVYFDKTTFEVKITD